MTVLSFRVILALFAAVCFLLATFNVASRVNLTAAGLLLLTIAYGIGLH